MSHKLRLSLLAVAAAFMALLLLPYGALAASNHAHSISRTLGSQGGHKSARAATLCSITAGVGTPCDYAYIYNTLSETVPAGGDIIFDNNGSMMSGTGIGHAPGAPGGSTITVATAGTYKITYTVLGLEPSRFALTVGGAAVPGTDYEVGANMVRNIGVALITIPASSTITLQNSSSEPVDLQTGKSVNASILIEQIA